MATPLRVLFIEDSTDEVNLILGELRRGGFEPSFAIAETRAAVENALDGQWEIAIIGDPLTKVDPLMAVALLDKQGIPCLVVAKELQRERVAALMQAGGRDTLGLGDLVRLVPAIRRELRDMGERIARREAEQKLHEGESFLASIFAGVKDGLSVIDRDFNIIKVNPAMELTHAAQLPLVGKKCYQVYQNRNERCEFCPCLQAMETGEPAEGLAPRMASGGEAPGWVAIYSFPLADQETGQISGVIECVHDVSERKRTEEALAAEKEWLAVTLQSIGDAVITTDEGSRIVLINKSAEELTGWSQDEAGGRPLSEILHLVDEAAKAPLTNPVDQILAAGSTVQLADHALLVARDGRKRTIACHGAPIRDRLGEIMGVVLAFRDTADHKRTEYELARERDLLHTLMDNIPDSIYFKDEACRYTRVNAAMARILGLDDTRDAIGKTVFDFLAGDSARLTYEDEQRIVQTGQPLINKIERISRGGTRWALTTKVPTRDQDGNVTGIVGISRDITERKRAEEELTQSFDRLRRSMEGAIQAMALTVEIRDPYTAGHQRRVAQLAHAIAKEMGLPGGQVDGIRLAAAIHDVGKIYIPAEILSKPGRITETEFSMIRTHPQVGHDILKIIEFPWPISLIVLQHHKRMDGSGYPPTMPHEEILLEARILSVADVVEAMSSHRPYRPALGIEKALREISMNSGLLYDPRVVAICLRLFTDKGFNFE